MTGVSRRVRYSVGLMSGTSTDGVDAALVRIRGEDTTQEVELLAATTIEFDDEMRDRIFAVYPPNRFAGEQISRLNFDLGEIYAQAVLAVIEQAGMKPSDIYCVGSRGLTVFHGPPEHPGVERGHRLEIGEAAIIAERTGIDVVSDYGYRDQAAFGLGGTIGSYVDWLLFHDAEKSRSIHNIGGIANLSYVKAGGDLLDTISFDTGPGNVFIDFAAAMVSGGKMRYDKDGQIAARGQVNGELVDTIVSHWYVQKSPPKSTGREVFTRTMFEELVARAKELRLRDEDLLATLTAATAKSMATNYDLFVFPRGAVDEIVLRGGGARNPVLVEMFRDRMKPIPVFMHEDFGYSTAYREAMDWAIVGPESMLGHVNNIPNVTGARRRIVFGKFTPGRFGWNRDPFEGRAPAD